jgi:selenide,water dikinase
LLSTLPPPGGDPDLLVGPESWSDAGVYRVAEDLALIQTVDFFTPVLDDPFDYGRAAAANALSDVYCMGGTPRTALAVVAFASDLLEIDLLAQILRGGLAGLEEAGVTLVGGHSVRDRETKFGYAVTGFVHPGRLVTQAGARPGDRVVLTKPIGTGVLTTALKRGLLPDEERRRVTGFMIRLNASASRLMLEHGATAATDVTGFGFFGHARNIAAASGVTLRIFAGAVPVLPGVHGFLEEGVYAGGLAKNEDFFARDVEVAATVPAVAARALHDPQTSGGLLVTLPAERADGFASALRAAGDPEAAVIGDVLAPSGKAILLVAGGRG